MKKDYKNAIHLALKLKHPMKMLNILTTVRKEFTDKYSFLGLESVDELIKNLDDEQVRVLRPLLMT